MGHRQLDGAFHHSQPGDGPRGCKTGAVPLGYTPSSWIWLFKKHDLTVSTFEWEGLSHLRGISWKEVR